MNQTVVQGFLVSAVALSSFAAEAKKPAPPPPPKLVQVCVPLCKGQYLPLSVPQITVSLLAKLGIFASSTYYKDADKDGFGTAAATSPCPNAGYVAVAGDCNDGNAAINPGGAEVCGNAADDNCSGAADEGCVVCPCFDADDLAAEHAAWQATAWDSSSQWCEDYTHIAPTYSYDWVRLRWFGAVTVDGITETQISSFYSVDYDDVTQATYCERFLVDEQVDTTTGGSVTYEEDYLRENLSADEHDKCKSLMLDYAAGHGISCQ